nr:PREDICTED: tRNA wybutosine-synthesizing protein 2 homolog isoform X1 [Latimeria chalumnae]XP_014341595.1 PREDICTED: tRNA wybutosine-synthesizing protein 2 homolog isoform X1 [Latimeria chalumnae]XP_014341596.1 PREDICTED: tRNA wybutosine-synthesizing protein 2 homolog isoform X1 [Latimeria chalumnae]|eukprot:XP_014341594.1 PREDICTED: tRNA wybutosine-synthesizing protein 2 homolog isoform X1 [Latimeria chalumnae]
MRSEAESDIVMAAIVTEQQHAQCYRKYLERNGLLDTSYRLQKQPDGTIALPVLQDRVTAGKLCELRESVQPESTCSLIQLKNPVPSKKSSVKSPQQRLQEELQALVEHRGGTWNSELRDDLPQNWKQHGDLILLSESSLRADVWKALQSELWSTVALALGVKRVARMGRISADGYRTPTVTLLHGEDGWAQHVDNGIRYTFDVTKCMFSSGNITEKLRIASFNCTGEVVVDLYAGIGYFTLPYLLHSRAAFVHACEWSPHAVTALKRNLELNGVSERCQVHQGDNRQVPLWDVADRVNLGLIPSSEEGWPTACQLLRKDNGGVLHIHQNVTSCPEKEGGLFCVSRDTTDASFPPAVQGVGKAESTETRGCVSGSTENSDAVQDSVLKHHRPESAGTSGKLVPSGKKALVKPEWQMWAELAESRISSLLQDMYGKCWRTKILHIEHVKSYAPHIDHLVLDLECRPP